MRKSWLAATLLASGMLAAALPAAAQTTLKMAYALSTSSHYGAGADAFAKSIEASGGGKFKVQQFANSALGGEREVIEGLQIGTIDLAIVSTGATLNFVSGFTGHAGDAILTYFAETNQTSLMIDLTGPGAVDFAVGTVGQAAVMTRKKTCV